MHRLIKARLFAFATLLAFPHLAKADPITIELAAFDHGLGLSTGVDLNPGSLLRVGYFTVSDSEVAANRFNYEYLNNNFVSFGSATTGTIDGTPHPDLAGGQFYWNLSGDPGTFAGRNIYLWAFSTPSLPGGAAFEPGTEIGIFKSTDLFPDGTPGNLGEGFGLDPFSVPPANIIVGGFGLGTVDAAGTNPGGAPLFNLASLTPTIRFQVATFNVLENAGTAMVTVLRDGNPAGAVSAQIASTGGTATAGEDYVAVSQSVDFADGETSKTVLVTITDDAVFEAPGFETVTLALSAPSGGAVLGTQAAAILRINDDESNPVGELNFSAATYVGSENAAGSGNSLLTITVTRTGGSAGAVAVDVAATGGTATADADFTLPASPVTLTWNDGEMGPKTFAITIIADSLDEGGSETFLLALGNATNGASIGAQEEATVTILDSDTTAPTLTVVNPKANAKITGSSVAFSGTATDNAAIARVEVALNSEAPQIVTPGTPTSSFQWTLNVTPEQGLNTAVVTAFDLQGNASASITRSFTFVNLRPQLTGTYNGLITLGPDSPTPINHYGLIAIKVLPTGVFTGKARLAGVSLPVKGVFQTDGTAKFGKVGTATQELIKKAKPANISLGHLSLAINTAGGDVITGILTDAAGAQVFATIPSADRALYTAKKNPAAPFMNVPISLLDPSKEKGKYTAIFQSDDSNTLPANSFPQGHGIGSISIARSGVAKVVGKLADGSPISYSNALSKNNEWPVFIAIYKKQGFVTGQVEFDPADPESDASAPNMRWFKPANAKDTIYPAGWPNGITVDFAASKHLAPKAPTAKVPAPPNPNTVLGPTVPGAASTTVANIVVTASGGALTSATSNDASLSAKGAVTVIGATAGETGLNGLKVKFVGATGAMSGTFTHPVTSKPVKFAGIAFQKTEAALGYFLFLPPKTLVGAAAESGAIGVRVAD